MRRGGRGALTLIEILVATTILLILAGLAVFHYREATVRTKVSRVLADLAVLRGGIEAYTTDLDGAPRMTWERAPFNDRYTGLGASNEPISCTLGPWMTTPVAYVPRFDMADPLGISCERVDGRMYTYQSRRDAILLERSWGEVVTYHPDRQASRFFDRDFGAWFLLSLGPDGETRPYLTPYDPTNGTTSAGNILVSHRHPGP